jgi:hypothetical protein
MPIVEISDQRPEESTQFDVPLCAECASKENKIGNLAWMPFFIVGMLTCVFGSAAGLFAGVIVGSLVEFGLRMLFAPKYGRLLLKRPLTIFRPSATRKSTTVFQPDLQTTEKL